MSIIIPPVRKSAPYIYLTKGPNEAKYTIFVYIPLLAGTVASRTGTPGTLPLRFRVEDGANPNSFPFYTKEELDPPENPPLLLEMKNEFGIEENHLDKPIVVEVTHAATIIDSDTKPSYKVALPFSDADSEDAPGAAADLIAMNCPYLYLTNPNAEIGGTDPNYAPRCHIPLEQGIGFSASAVDNSENGKYIEIVVLESNGSTATEVPSHLIKANQGIYSDDGRKTGRFEVIIPPIVTAAGAKPRRRGRLPNRSSDTNPSSFLS
ncbi:MAG: hypothetical protein ACKVU2_16700 [Saprospiraceae bacterium]